jgi:DUF2892 family protein
MNILVFLSSTAGRWTRAVVGLVLIALGAALGAGWWTLAVLGVVFVFVGLLDVCLLAPLFGKPLRGTNFRSAVR